MTTLWFALYCIVCVAILGYQIDYLVNWDRRNGLKQWRQNEDA